MKILHITAWPGPPFNGGRINRYHVLKRLSMRHDFRFIILREPDDDERMDAPSLTNLGIKNSGVRVICKESISLLSRLRFLISSEYPPGIVFYERTIGADLHNIFKEMTAEWVPDTILIWSPNLAKITVDLETNAKRILFACDSLSMLNRSIALQSSNLVRQIYHRQLAIKYARYEQDFYPLFDEIVFNGKRDAEATNLPSSVSVRIIRNGVDTHDYQPINRSKDYAELPKIVFHGDLSYIANEGAVRCIASDIGPTILRKLGNNSFRVEIFGGKYSSALFEFLANKPWIELKGYVKELGPALALGTVYAAPIKMGGGIKNKILEAMACGLAVVGTPEAFSSLDIISGTHAIICSPDRIAGEIIELLCDSSRREALGCAARKWVLENASWEVTSNQFEMLFTRVG